MFTKISPRTEGSLALNAMLCFVLALTSMNEVITAGYKLSFYFVCILHLSTLCKQTFDNESDYFSSLSNSVSTPNVRPNSLQPLELATSYFANQEG